MLSALCVVGHPSRLGGADTELDHQIRCWQYMGLEVHICPTAEPSREQRMLDLEARGCIYHDTRDWGSLDGLHCISFCNGDFLTNLPRIARHARTTTFVNCMTWNFAKELEMQEKGLIDYHLYQTKHAFERVSQKLRPLSDYRPLFFQPYFHLDDFPFVESRPADRFQFGRISRCDADKYSKDQLQIYDAMVSPHWKAACIVGWGDKARAKLGVPADWIMAVPEGGMQQQEFYRFCDAVIMSTDTFENLPRVGFEAMASGSLLVVDRKGGWKLQVEDGDTGWLCGNFREFVYKASRAAFEPQEREEMRRRARARLESQWGMEASAKSWEQVFEHLVKHERR